MAQRKKTSPRLTANEQRLLRYPPTPRTWRCVRKKVVDQSHMGDGTVKEVCDTLNSGPQKVCWCCGHAKPAKPTLYWPAYERACKKAGIEPGDRWPPRVTSAASEEDVKKPTTRRKKG